jgi:hypothetical protein
MKCLFPIALKLIEILGNCCPDMNEIIHDSRDSLPINSENLCPPEFFRENKVWVMGPYFADVQSSAKPILSLSLQALGATTLKPLSRYQKKVYFCEAQQRSRAGPSFPFHRLHTPVSHLHPNYFRGDWRFLSPFPSSYL